MPKGKIKAGKKPEVSQKPKKHWFLAVGVGELEGASQLTPLPYAADDCQDITSLLAAGRVASGVKEIIALHDKVRDENLLPTAANLLNQLEIISREAGNRDTVVVYLTCHGTRGTRDRQQLYFRLRDRLIPAQELIDLLIESQAQNIVLLIDSCHSGALKLPRLPSQIGKNLYAILSCLPEQESYSYDNIGSALMSHCIKQALNGYFSTYQEKSSDSTHKNLCCDSLYNFLNQEMKRVQNELHRNRELCLHSSRMSSLSDEPPSAILRPKQQPIRQGGSTGNPPIIEVLNNPSLKLESRRVLIVNVSEEELETSLQTQLREKASFNKLQVWNGREQLSSAIEAQLNFETGTVLLYFRGTLLSNNELKIGDRVRLTATALKQLLEQHQSVKQILLFDLDTGDEANTRQWLESIKIDSELGQCIVINRCSQELSTLAQDTVSILAQTDTEIGLTAADFIDRLKQQNPQRDYFLAGERDIIEVVFEPRTSNSYREIGFWLNYVQKYLPQEISSNFLTSFVDSRASFKTKEFYVPLGLVERKKVERKSEIDSSEEGSRLYGTEIVEVTQKFAGEEFYRDILKERQGKTNGKRIAITGEPGGGKTTLSQDICGWLCKTQTIPIWISLAQLCNSSLTEFLEQVWLSKIARDSQIELEQLQKALQNQFRQGNVWLILDGVDEINDSEKIGKLNDYLQEGYIDFARVIVTCRLNTWETTHQLFNFFETYRTLPFSDSDIEQFAGRFFADRAEKDNLITQLEQNQRIKDLVRNPLRLMLLCLAWLQGEGTLPETQAQLYDLFVEQFYEFKQDKFPIFKTRRSRKLKKLVHQTLGEISKEILDRDNPSFLIDFDSLSDELQDHLDEEIEEKTVFDWIIDLGWLNNVGVSADDPHKTVYTFFHATFQEYFAAIAINDWDYFLPREHTNFPVPNKKYRCFDAQWKQVILFWIGGKRDIKEKEKFLNKLVGFDENCDKDINTNYFQKLYNLQCFCLAGTIINEFKTYSHTKKVVDEILSLYINNYFDDEYETIIFSINIEYIQEYVIAYLIKWIQANYNSTKNKIDILFFIKILIFKLAEIKNNDTNVILLLEEIIQNASDKNLVVCSIEALSKTNYDCSHIILNAIEQIKLSKNTYDLDFYLSILSKVAINDTETIRELSELAKTTNDYSFFVSLIHCLSQIGIGNEKLILLFVELIENTNDKWTYCILIRCLYKISIDYPNSIYTFIKLIETIDDEFCCIITAEYLSKIANHNYDAVSCLRKLIKQDFNISLYHRIATSLIEIDYEGHYIALSCIYTIMQNTKDKCIIYDAIKCILKIIKNDFYELVKISTAFKQDKAIITDEKDTNNFYLAFSSINNIIEYFIKSIKALHYSQDIYGATLDNLSILQSFKCLSLIKENRDIIISFLIEFIRELKNWEIIDSAMYCLSSVGKNSDLAISFLIKFIREAINNGEESDIIYSAIRCLSSVAYANVHAAYLFVELINDESSYTQIAIEELKHIVGQNKKLMADCMSKLECRHITFENEDFFSTAAQILPYSNFYAVWHFSV